MKAELFTTIEDSALGIIPKTGRILLGVGAPLGLLPNLSQSVIADVESGTIATASNSAPEHMGDEQLFENNKANLGINNFFNFWTRKIEYDAVVLEALEIDDDLKVNVDRVNDRIFGGRGGAVAALKRSKMAIILPTLGRESHCKEVSFESYCLNDCLPRDAKALIVFPDGVEEAPR